MKIRVQSVGRSTVKVTADCSPNSQLIDWGKSRENVDRFLETLDGEAMEK